MGRRWSNSPRLSVFIPPAPKRSLTSACGAAFSTTIRGLRVRSASCGARARRLAGKKRPGALARPGPSVRSPHFLSKKASDLWPKPTTALPLRQAANPPLSLRPVDAARALGVSPGTLRMDEAGNHSLRDRQAMQALPHGDASPMADEAGERGTLRRRQWKGGDEVKSHPLDVVLDRLRSQGSGPRSQGKGYSCRCPAHEDRSPSLSIGPGDDGRVLVHCQAGCTLDAALAALVLEPRDLFHDDATDSAPRSSPRPAPQRTTDKRTFPTWQAAVADCARKRGEPVATWEYHDADDRLVRIQARFNTTTSKTFLPFKLTDAGSWVCEGMPTPRPLYRLPSVLATSETVYVAEGEKAADALASLGLCVTTSPNGSKSAAKADWTPLRGRRVVIVPDRDEPGERYADEVADVVRQAGAESMVVVRLADHWPDLPDGGDAHDWIEHHDAAEPDDLRAAIERLAAVAVPVTAVADAPEDDSDEVLAWEPFPTDQPPAPLDRFVRERARGIGCDESMVALPVIAAMAGSLGKRKGDHVESSVLWTAAVAESACGKTPAFKTATQFADAEQKKCFDAYAIALADFDAEMMEHDAAVAEWKRKTGRSDPAPGALGMDE
jgi:hypothetical protein